MMGGILTAKQVEQFKTIMEWEGYQEEDNIPDEIKLTLLDTGYRKQDRLQSRDSEEVIRILLIFFKLLPGSIALRTVLWVKFSFFFSD